MEPSTAVDPQGWPDRPTYVRRASSATRTELGNGRPAPRLPVRRVGRATIPAGIDSGCGVPIGAASAGQEHTRIRSALAAICGEKSAVSGRIASYVLAHSCNGHPRALSRVVAKVIAVDGTTEPPHRFAMLRTASGSATRVSRSPMSRRSTSRGFGSPRTAP